MLLRLFCKRIHDQKRRFKILTHKDAGTKVADVFCMFDEMEPHPNNQDLKRKFKLTVADVAHWAGLTTEEASEEIKRLTANRKIEVVENTITVANIAEMKRLVENKKNNLG